MNNYQKTDVPYLVTKRPGEIVNTDTAALRAYKDRSLIMQKKNSEIEQLQGQINIMSSELSDIKSMLQQVLKAQNG